MLTALPPWLRLVVVRIDFSWCDGVISENCKDLLTRMLDRNVDTRITVPEILVRSQPGSPHGSLSVR